jgi:drug/metabolite transporter (DMT)-like permease
MGSKEWLLYVAVAGLAWGTYVPLIAYGGNEFVVPKGNLGGRLMAILCVGVAYLVIAVVLPLIMFFSGSAQWPDLKTTGLVFSSLAGVAGAVGALCVVFATKAAIEAAKEAEVDPSTYRLYIAPLIFGLAPVINTAVSLVWHPKAGDPWHFGFKAPHWLLYVGIVFVGLGAAMVLYAKELGETAAHQAPPKKEGTQGQAAPDAAPRPAGDSVSSPS